MKLEIVNKMKTGKFTNMCRLYSTLLNNPWVKEESTREIRKYVETNENEITVYQKV